MQSRDFAGQGSKWKASARGIVAGRLRQFVGALTDESRSSAAGLWESVESKLSAAHDKQPDDGAAPEKC
jgi:hypothetical protein